MTYIFLTPELGSMGGSQMYVCNKSTYLRAMGWNVKIVYFTQSELLIKKLSEFESIYTPELAWGIQYYLPWHVKTIVKRLVSSININDSDVVIESCLYHLSFWGEILASKIRAKHILHFLEEDIPPFGKRIACFMDYKLKRWECMNAEEKSLKRLFKIFYRPEYKKYEFKTDFFCSNVFDGGDNISETNYQFDNSDDTILSLGRLDKPYITEMVEQVVMYSTRHSNRKINFIFIGGSPNGKDEDSIKQKLSVCPNLKSYFLGYLFPIPERVIKSSSVAIATSNSVLIPYNLGVPTIAVDANDFFAIGLYGIDTKYRVFRRDEKQVPISDYLERVLINKDFSMPEKKQKPRSMEEILDDHFKEQLSFVRRSTGDKTYYKIDEVFSYGEIIRGILVRAYTRIKG